MACYCDKASTVTAKSWVGNFISRPYVSLDFNALESVTMDASANIYEMKVKAYTVSKKIFTG